MSDLEFKLNMQKPVDYSVFTKVNLARHFNDDLKTESRVRITLPAAKIENMGGGINDHIHYI